jgi:hypothetical protein
MMILSFVQGRNLPSKTNNGTAMQPIGPEIDCIDANFISSRIPWMRITAEIPRQGKSPRRKGTATELIATEIGTAKRAGAEIPSTRARRRLEGNL